MPGHVVGNLNIPMTVLVDPVSGLAVTPNSGQVTQAIPDYQSPTDVATAWGMFSGVDTAGGDFVTSVSGLNGQFITVLSGSPLTTGESYVTNAETVTQPCALEFAGSVVRTGLSFATASLFENADTGPDVVPSPINITSIYQSTAVQGAAYNATAGTNLTVVLETALPVIGSNQAVFIGDWVNITGLIDNRLNYANACINYISPDRKTICIGFSDEVALPSLAVAAITPTLGTAKVNFYNNMSGARNGFGLRFTGISSTSAAVVSIFGGDDNQVSGTLLGDHRVTVANAAPNYVSGGNFGQYEIRANSRYRFECKPRNAAMIDRAEGASSAWTLRDTLRDSAKPVSDAKLQGRFRLYKPISMTRPVAKIVSAVKATASTTATVTIDITCSEAGIVTNGWYNLKGARDSATNFPNTTTPVQVTVTGANTFTCVWGAAAIATTYGGTVIKVNGGRDQPGLINSNIQSVQSVVADGNNWLQVVGSTTFAGLVNLGDYVNSHGVRSATNGSDLSLDGAWEVANIATTTLLLKPVFDVFGNRVSPALGTLGLTNAGGAIIIRPTLRSHDIMLSQWTESQQQLEGQGTLRADMAMPVAVIGTVSASTTESTLVTPSVSSVVTAASTNATSIKTTAGSLFCTAISNITAATIYVKYYNKASAPTVGTDVPVLTIPVPAGSTQVIETGRVGLRFSTGIAMAVTAAAAATDTTVVTAGAQISTSYI